MLGPDSQRHLIIKIFFSLFSKLVRNLKIKSPGFGYQIAISPGNCAIYKIHGRRSDKSADKFINRVIVDRIRCIHLLNKTVFHDNNSIPHGHGL